MSKTNETKKAPIKRLSLSRETVKNLNVRTAMRTGLFINPFATQADQPSCNPRGNSNGNSHGSVQCPTTGDVITQ